MHGQGANELRFSLPEGFDSSHYLSSNKKVKIATNFDLEPEKQTLKEFNKTIYYSSGDYDKVNHRVLVEPKMLVGQHHFRKQIDRESAPMHYIKDAPGFRVSAHLDAPEEDAVTRKFKKLGHVTERKLVGWDLMRPRDNSMYHVGEGEANLKKMDKHIKRKQGGSILNLFSANVINDEKLKQEKKRKVRATLSSASKLKQLTHSRGESARLDQMSNSTAASINRLVGDPSSQIALNTIE